VPSTESVRALARKFSRDRHLINHRDVEWSRMFSETGEPLYGIRGKALAEGLALVDLVDGGLALGVDLIEMRPGAAFPLHVHPGDHCLIGHVGAGMVEVNGVDHPVSPGTTVFIAADQPHGVKTYLDSTEIHRRTEEDRAHQVSIEPFRQSGGLFSFFAVGVPHEHVESRDRMQLVDE
jgi:quercetin dioxygenase-like cupin family protein